MWDRQRPRASVGCLHRLIAGQVSLLARRLTLHIAEMQAPAHKGNHHDPGLIGPVMV